MMNLTAIDVKNNAIALATLENALSPSFVTDVETAKIFVNSYAGISKKLDKRACKTFEKMYTNKLYENNFYKFLTENGLDNFAKSSVYNMVKVGHLIEDEEPYCSIFLHKPNGYFETVNEKGENVKYPMYAKTDFEYAQLQVLATEYQKTIEKVNEKGKTVKEKVVDIDLLIELYTNGKIKPSMTVKELKKANQIDLTDSEEVATEEVATEEVATEEVATEEVETEFAVRMTAKQCKIVATMLTNVLDNTKSEEVKKELTKVYNELSRYLGR